MRRRETGDQEEEETHARKEEEPNRAKQGEKEDGASHVPGGDTFRVVIARITIAWRERIEIEGETTEMGAKGRMKPTALTANA